MRKSRFTDEQVVGIIRAAGLHAVLGGEVGIGLSQREAGQGCQGDGADEGKVGAVSTLAAGAAAGAVPAGLQAGGCIAATGAGAGGAEPSVELRLHVRPLHQRRATEEPDGDGRVHQGRPGDRRRRTAPLAAGH